MAGRTNGAAVTRELPKLGRRGETGETYGDGVGVALGSASDLDDSDLEVARVRGIATSRGGGLRRDG